MTQSPKDKALLDAKDQIRRGAQEDLYRSDPSRSGAAGRKARSASNISGDLGRGAYVGRPSPELSIASGPEIKIRRASDVAATQNKTRWLFRPYLELDSIGVFYGDYGTLKSFIALDWCLRIACGMPALGFSWPARRVPVLYVSPEGRSLSLRLRAWEIKNLRNVPGRPLLSEAELFCIENPINLSDPACALQLVAAIQRVGFVPGLIVLDTLSQNSDGRVEQSNADAGAYLAVISQFLRARFRCAVLLIHHVGHMEKGRIRGPIALASNTDTLIRVDGHPADALSVTVTVERQKDSEPPPPHLVRAKIINLQETDADGEPMSSLALECSAPLPVHEKQAAALGPMQARLLSALRGQSDADRPRSLAEIKKIGREAGIPRTTVEAATNALVKKPAFMEHVDGGWRPVPVKVAQ